MQTAVAIVVFIIFPSLRVASGYGNSISDVERKLISSSVDVDDMYALEDLREEGISKRAVTATAVLRGIGAVKKLLRGATEVPSNDMSMKVFEKTGSYQTAIGDFKAIKPKPVDDRRFPYGNKIVFEDKVIYGKVGDRLLKFDKADEGGNPTLVVYRKIDASHYTAYKIIYKDIGKDKVPR